MVHQAQAADLYYYSLHITSHSTRLVPPFPSSTAAQRHHSSSSQSPEIPNSSSCPAIARDLICTPIPSLRQLSIILATVLTTERHLHSCLEPQVTTHRDHLHLPSPSFGPNALPADSPERRRLRAPEHPCSQRGRDHWLRDWHCDSHLHHVSSFPMRAHHEQQKLIHFRTDGACLATPNAADEGRAC